MPLVAATVLVEEASAPGVATGTTVETDVVAFTGVVDLVGPVRVTVDVLVPVVTGGGGKSGN
ncbi:MAG TPA: hypothetical protein VF719_02535 [Abditibacteriaceae bacterium]